MILDLSKEGRGSNPTTFRTRPSVTFICVIIENE